MPLIPGIRLRDHHDRQVVIPASREHNAGFLSELLSRLEGVGVGRKCQASVILPVKFFVKVFELENLLESKWKVEKTPIKFSHQRNDECGVTTIELRPGWQRTGRVAEETSRGSRGGRRLRERSAVSFSFSLQPLATTPPESRASQGQPELVVPNVWFGIRRKRAPAPSRVAPEELVFLNLTNQNLDLKNFFKNSARQQFVKGVCSGGCLFRY